MSIIVRVLRQVASALDRAATTLEAAQCTGAAASWCPIHGDCVCSPADVECPQCGAGSDKVITKGQHFMCHGCSAEWPYDQGRACFDSVDKNSPYCPLHSGDSSHAIGAAA